MNAQETFDEIGIKVMKNYGRDPEVTSIPFFGDGRLKRVAFSRWTLFVDGESKQMFCFDKQRW